MPKSKLTALASLLLVFLSGALVGAVVQRLYMVTSVSSTASVNPPAQARKQTPEEVRKHLIGEMRDRVKLDDGQVEELEAIYDRTRERFDELFQKRNAEARALWDSQNEQIRQMLRPDQVPLFQRLHAEHEAARKNRKRADDSK
jgi:hypothetical protein